MSSQVEIFSRHRRALEDVEIARHDFTRPPCPTRGPMQALVSLHEAFAGDLARALSARLREPVRITLDEVEQTTCGTYVSRLPRPTCAAVIRVETLRTAFLLELSPAIAFPLIDRLLGGSSRELFVPQRPMSQVELQLVTRLLHEATDVLAAVWRPVAAIDPRVERIETVPRAFGVGGAGDPVIVVRFAASAAGHVGPMSLSMPQTAIAPLVETLAGRKVTAGRRTDPATAAAWMARHVREAEMELTAVLARTTITLGELQRLEVGDVIVTRQAAAGPVILEAGGVRLEGSIGRRAGRRAIRIA